MRVGQNPIKSVESIAPPAPITVVVISSIPFLQGYYADGLEILKLCLGSLRAHTEGDYDLLVFDNGSCLEVRDYLVAEQNEQRIEFLLLSERNLGKPAAWNAAFAAAPGEFVAYADSDVYFHPGWLQASLTALKAIPNAGMVTAMPMLIPEKYNTATLAWAKKQPGAKIEKGELLPWDEFWKHARSLGDVEAKARNFYSQNKTVRISYKGKRYFAGAAHFQFTARKSALHAVLPIPAERPMGRVRLLDEAMNAAGFLRFCTEAWYVQHLGNVMPETRGLELLPQVAKKPAKISRFWRWTPIRKLLQWIYGWSFNRLYRG